MYFEHPRPKAVIAQDVCLPPPHPDAPPAPHPDCLPCSIAKALQEQFGTAGPIKCSGVRHCKGWARQGRFAIERCRDTVGLSTAGILCCWVLQEYSAVAVGLCRDTVLLLGTAGILGGWVYLVVGHCRDTLRLGSAGILCGWTLQGHVAIEHCSQALRRGRGQHRLLKSNNLRVYSP